MPRSLLIFLMLLLASINFAPVPAQNQPKPGSPSPQTGTRIWQECVGCTWIFGQSFTYSCSRHCETWSGWQLQVLRFRLLHNVQKARGRALLPLGTGSPEKARSIVSVVFTPTRGVIHPSFPLTHRLYISSCTARLPFLLLQ